MKRYLMNYGPVILLGGLIILIQYGTGKGTSALISDVFFAIGTASLLIGLILQLRKMKMFASFSWGTRMLKRIFTREAKTGRIESESYALYRANYGNHVNAFPYLLFAVIFILLSALAVRL